MKYLLFIAIYLTGHAVPLAQVKVEIGKPETDNYLSLLGPTNTNALLLDGGNITLRHHQDFLSTKRDQLFFFIDADNNQSAAQFAIYKNTSVSSGQTPILRMHLDGGDSWINSGGNLGIGDTAPTERLSVNGAIKIGNNNFNTPGVIRFNNNEFQGYTNGMWNSLTRDADADTLNEIQSITRTGTTLTLSKGGGSVSIADNDNSATNELQTLSLSGNLLSISSGNSVTLPGGSGSGDRIVDADGDTWVDAEPGPDADLVDINLDGQLRFRLGKTSGSGRAYIDFHNNSENILIGATGANVAYYGNNNIYIGSATASLNQTGSNNIMIGKSIGTLQNAQNQNVYIGNEIGGLNAGDENVAAGFQAGRIGTYSRSVLLGYQAGQSASSGGSVFIGYKAGENVTNSGYWGTVIIGHEAGSTLVNTAGNTFIGNNAGKLATGNDNTFLGYYAGALTSSGSDNTFLGTNAGNDNTTGGQNTFLGAQSGSGNTIGIQNTFVGFAGINNSSGDQNTSIGFSSGNTLTTGQRNTYLGQGADATIGTIEYSMGLGYATLTNASHQIRIGGSNITSIGGYEPWSNISDGRYKSNVKQNVPGLDFIQRLRPITYQLDARKIENDLRAGRDEILDASFLEALIAKEQMIKSGFIAQEVEQAAQSIGYTFSGIDAPKHENDMYALRYAEFTVPLVQAVQELAQQNEVLLEMIIQLQQEIISLKADVQQLRN